MTPVRWIGLIAALSLAALIKAPAFATGLDAAYPGSEQGPEHAKGAVVWSHGRSITSEDAASPTPPYLTALRDGGWDVLRFNRPRDEDTLSSSTQRLVEKVAELKEQGYRRIVLAGQSFGAFLSLMAADASDDVDAVVATAPAAFGSFDDFYDTWRLNATRLYPLLEKIKRARVMLFYFHDDDFDPGGRSEPSRAILSERGLGYAVIDQPAYLTGHWASGSGVFLRRFGSCIRDFSEADGLSGPLHCSPRWGQSPSAELQLPEEVLGQTAAQPSRTEASAQGGSAMPGSVPGIAPGGVDTWYGFYPNGREVLLAVDTVKGSDISAIYAIGPSIDKKYGASWTRRRGRIDEDAFVFEEKGRSTLKFEVRPDGGLSATWTAADGKGSMSARLRRIEPSALAALSIP
ncbi:MAG: alpha/beta hydrolase [Alphaproteobacteria bacterium]|nr:alpha/beta hydrolase [Alphaproteobacteria bacterium]